MSAAELERLRALHTAWLNAFRAGNYVEASKLQREMAKIGGAS